ncbi:MAG: hypothetical protein Kow0069_08300 [Promethearchaeota archaeon]
MSREEITEIVRSLICQQFVGDSDVVYGRTRDVSVVVPGSGALVSRLTGLLARNAEIVLEGRHREYLEGINEVIPIPVASIAENYERTLSVLEQTESQPDVVLSLLVAEVLTQKRVGIFQVFMVSIENYAKARTPFPERVREVISSLYSTNDPNVSLLYNLSFLTHVAEHLEDDVVARLARGKSHFHFNQLVASILRGVEQLEGADADAHA